MMNNKDNNYVVYRHTNKINGKVYIGITCQNPEARWKNGLGYRGCTLFDNAIQKYGWDNFEHDILFDGLSRDEAIHMEETLISEYHANEREYGYNLTSGGENNIPSDTTRQKMSEVMSGPANKMRGRKHTQEEIEWYRQRFSGEGNPRYGTHLSDSTKQKISDA